MPDSVLAFTNAPIGQKPGWSISIGATWRFWPKCNCRESNLGRPRGTGHDVRHGISPPRRLVTSTGPARESSRPRVNGPPHVPRHTVVVYHPAQLSNTPPHVPSDGSGDTRIEDGCRDGLVALTPAAHTKEAYTTPRNRRPSYLLGPHQYRCFESTLPGSTRAVRHVTGSGLWQILEDERILSRSGLTFSHCDF